MRHATREGNRPSFWSYLKVSVCRGCQKQEEKETTHHVISGGCEAMIGKTKNNRYRAEIRRALGKCRKLMNDTHNSEGETQVDKALTAMD
eukprot:6179292-Pleurochrysis_carterae.AAC.5